MRNLSHDETLYMLFTALTSCWGFVVYKFLFTRLGQANLKSVFGSELLALNYCTWQPGW